MNLQPTPRTHTFFDPFLSALFAAISVLLISPVTAEITFLGTFGSIGLGNGQFQDPVDVALSDSGHVYVADYARNHVQWFDATGNYLGQWGSSGNGDGQFSGAASLAVGANGHVYVTDIGNDRVQRFDAVGNYLGQWGSFGSGDGEFKDPEFVSVSAAGHVYVSEAAGYRIQRFDAIGNYLGQWGNSGSGDGQFDFIGGVAVSTNDQVYVTDRLNNRIQRFDAIGNYLGQWGSYGTGAGQFDRPWNIEVSTNGLVYVSDIFSDRIQKFDATGNYLGQWGSTGTGDGEFDKPKGIRVSPSGIIYIADSENQRIHRYLDSDAWVSGVNSFVDGTAGPISVEVGSGEILGTSLTLDASKGLEVGDVTTIQSDGSLTIDGGWLSTASLVNNGSFEFNSGQLAITSSTVTVDPSGLLGKNVEIDGNKVFEPYILKVGSISGGSLTVADGGSVTTVLNATISEAPGDSGSAVVSGFGSSLTVGNYLDVGLNGNATLHIADGANVSSIQATIAGFSGAGVVTVTGAGSRWDIDQSLHVAGDHFSGPGGTATLDVTDAATVSAGVDFVVHPSGTVRLDRGGTISATTINNDGQLSGSGNVVGSFTNDYQGEVQVLSGSNLVFSGGNGTNNSQITLDGGQIHFTGSLTNAGPIIGNGTLRADGGTNNDGTLAFSATTNVIGDFTNNMGTVISSGGTTTFFDDVVNYGEVRTNANSFNRLLRRLQWQWNSHGHRHRDYGWRRQAWLESRHGILWR